MTFERKEEGGLIFHLFFALQHQGNELADVDVDGMLQEGTAGKPEKLTQVLVSYSSTCGIVPSGPHLSM